MENGKLFFYSIKISAIIVAICIVGCGEGRNRQNSNSRDCQNIMVDHPNDSLIDAKTSSELSPPIINVYVENSASMDGYVKGVTAFEQAVYSYLSDINIKMITDSLNLFYINSKPILYGSDITDFIEKLEPTTFKQRGGNRGTTDISSLLSIILKKCNNRNVSILISDCIFSPGRKNAENYLINQQIGIKSSFANFLKMNPEHGVVIYRLESEFDGYYYDKFDKPHKYKGKRPYYIWLIGNKKYLKELKAQCPVSNFKGGGVKNIFSIMNGDIPIDYAVKYRSGNFKLDRDNPKYSIVEAKKDNKGDNRKLRFSVNVDFSELLCDTEYLLEEDNYQLNDIDFDIDIIESSGENRHSHTLKLSSNIVKPSTLIIKVKSKVPNWVEKANDDVGIGINDECETFGFKYLIQGLYEGFTVNGNEYTTMKININK